MARFKSRKQGNRSRKTYGGTFEEFMGSIKGIVNERTAVGKGASNAGKMAVETQRLATEQVENLTTALKAAQEKEAKLQQEKVEITRAAEAKAVTVIQAATEAANTKKTDALAASELAKKNAEQEANEAIQAAKNGLESEKNTAIQAKDAEIAAAAEALTRAQGETATAMASLKAAAEAANAASTNVKAAANAAIQQSRLLAPMLQEGGRRRRTHRHRAHKTHKRSHRK